MISISAAHFESSADEAEEETGSEVPQELVVVDTDATVSWRMQSLWGLSKVGGGHFGARYVDILPYFCQLSHTIDQGEILFSHSILKDLPEKDIFKISFFFLTKMVTLFDFYIPFSEKGTCIFRNKISP